MIPSVRFAEPREFLDELRIRREPLDGIVRLDHLIADDPRRGGTPAHWLLASFVVTGRDGAPAELILLQTGCGPRPGARDPDEDERTVARASALAAEIEAEVRALGYAPRPGRHLIGGGV
jgi:hypothetical protein